ncbi:MAG: hypothetical protein HQK50_18090 [Oligoflexia bacterium]|nr:hypothetical protein [Oligoflexia bacterium]
MKRLNLLKRYKKCNCLFNERGVSLLEVITASGLMLGAFLSASVFFSATNKTSIKVFDDIQSTISLYGGSKILQEDFFNAIPTFNFFCLLDDSNQSFFDWNENDTDGTRSLTLTTPTSAGSYSAKSLYLLVIDWSTRVDAYPLGKIPLGAEWPYKVVGSAVTYKGINHPEIHPNNNLGDASKFPSTPWVKDAIVLLSTGISYKDQEYECSPGNKTALYRPLRFLGYINGSNPLNVSTLTPLYESLYNDLRLDFITRYKIEGVTGEPIAIVGEKDFFDHIVVEPGKSLESYVEKVYLVRYRIQANVDYKTGGKLLRSRLACAGTSTTTANCQFEKESTLIDNVNSITFFRTVRTPSISYSISVFKR